MAGLILAARRTMVSAAAPLSFLLVAMRLVGVPGTGAALPGKVSGAGVPLACCSVAVRLGFGVLVLGAAVLLVDLVLVLGVDGVAAGLLAVELRLPARGAAGALAGMAFDALARRADAAWLALALRGVTSSLLARCWQAGAAALTAGCPARVSFAGTIPAVLVRVAGVSTVASIPASPVCGRPPGAACSSMACARCCWWPACCSAGFAVCGSTWSAAGAIPVALVRGDGLVLAAILLVRFRVLALVTWLAGLAVVCSMLAAWW